LPDGDWWGVAGGEGGVSATVQNVNLYLPEFRKKKVWLDAEKTVLIAGAGLLLMLVATAVDYWQLTQLRGDLAAKGEEYEQATAETAELLAQYGVQTEDPALLANIRELEEDLQSKQALLQFLEGRELGNAAGFSEYLADLSRHHVQGLSVNYVSLTEGGRAVEFEGEVLRPELALDFLQELGKGNAYAGMEFEGLQIEDVPLNAGSADAEVPVTEVAAWTVRSLKQAD
jgi:hypothetical protein